MNNQLVERVRVYVRKRPKQVDEEGLCVNEDEIVNNNSLTLDKTTNYVNTHVNNDSETFRSATILADEGRLIYRSYRPRGDPNIKQTWNDKMTEKNFQFTENFGEMSKQNEIFEVVAIPLIDTTLQGYSAAIVAYGATGTGKTYTMRGNRNNPNDRGIMSRSVEYILSGSNGRDVELWMTYLQVYCEQVTDLLSEDENRLTLRENGRGKVYADGASKVRLRTVDEFESALREGDLRRVTAATNFNETSSRSHAICILTIKNIAVCTDGTITESQLYFVDLAGSERAEGSVGRNYMRHEEAKAINLSLTTLGLCVNALVNNRSHVPYRDSKLTRLLQSCLAVESRFALIATIDPGEDERGEVLNTLRFASRARNVVVNAVVSRVVDYEALYNNTKSQLEEALQRVTELEVALADQSNQLDLQATEIDSLRSQVNVLQSQSCRRCAVAAAEAISSSTNDRFPINTSKALDAAVSNQDHELEMKQLRKQYDDKINEMKATMRQSTTREEKLKLELREEKNKHLLTLQNYRHMQEKMIQEESNTAIRMQELASDLETSQREIDNLNEQLAALTSYAKRTTEQLEESEAKMISMVTLTQVQEMEQLFMETVAKLSDRVKQLETPRAHSASNIVNNNNNESSGILPGRTIINDPLSRTARIEPGGRIRR